MDVIYKNKNLKDYNKNELIEIIIEISKKHLKDVTILKANGLK